MLCSTLYEGLERDKIKGGFRGCGHLHGKGYNFFPLLSILQSVFTRMAVVKALEKISEAKFLK